MSMKKHASDASNDLDRSKPAIRVTLSERVRRVTSMLPRGLDDRCSSSVALSFGGFFDSLRSLRMTDILGSLSNHVLSVRKGPGRPRMTATLFLAAVIGLFGVLVTGCGGNPQPVVQAGVEDDHESHGDAR